jgi:hypothetical protein
MGSRHLIGFDLEIMEPNFLRFTDQAVQYPAFVRPRPATGDGNLLLKRLVVVVESLQHTYENLVALFTPASRSNPYAVAEGREGKAFDLSLGGIEVRYCQPISRDGALADELARFGQGVIAVEFGARDMAGIIARGQAAGIAVEQGFDLLGAQDERQSSRIRCRALTGFDVLVGPLRGQPL